MVCGSSCLAKRSIAGLDSYYGKLRTEVVVAGVSGPVPAGLYESTVNNLARHGAARLGRGGPPSSPHGKSASGPAAAPQHSITGSRVATSRRHRGWVWTGARRQATLSAEGRSANAGQIVSAEIVFPKTKFLDREATDVDV